MTPNKTQLLALADVVEGRMITNAKNALNQNPGVTGQAKCMEYAADCAAVAAALRALAAHDV